MCVASRWCAGAKLSWPRILAGDGSGERETSASNQRKWGAVDLPAYLSKLVSPLDVERPTELISSRDSNNCKRETTQKIEP